MRFHSALAVTLILSFTNTTSTQAQTVEEMFQALIVQDEVTMGYDRDLFPHWIDADSNKCNTRFEVLIAEAVVKPKILNGCKLSGGRWQSVYDLVNTTNPSSFDVDHMVPLNEAWQSGAHAWSNSQRRAFANDLDLPQALIAVTASSNRSKSDREPHNWMPANKKYHCTYLQSWVVVKFKWRLSVDSTEQSWLQTQLLSLLVSLVVLCP